MTREAARDHRARLNLFLMPASDDDAKAKGSCQMELASNDGCRLSFIGKIKGIWDLIWSSVGQSYFWNSVVSKGLQSVTKIQGSPKVFAECLQ